MEDTLKKITFVIPIFNEEESLPELISQLAKVSPDIAQYGEPRFLFVNNGSTDDSQSVIVENFPQSTAFGVLSLSRNFGYETAIVAGLNFCESEIYGVLDGDGEDPVDLLPFFTSELFRGFDIVQGLRLKREESFFIQKFRSFSYWLLAKISDEPFVANVGNFSVFDRKVRDAISIENRSFPFMRATLSRVGYKVLHVPHDRSPRIAGKSKYKKFSLIKYALLCFLTSTTWPLRVSAYVSTINIIAIPALIPLLLHFQQNALYFLTSLVLLLQLTLMAGVLSIYTARIYKQIIGRPTYYLDLENSYFSPYFNR
jgi:glycosyltransferase involved in cell wall biosynthesis